MKKRSLVSAIAMLVVSAIVLTSATFAWFATGNKATVETINAKVTNADGSILLSADGQSWDSTLTVAQLDAQDTNIFPAQKVTEGEGTAAVEKYSLSPVSLSSDGKVTSGTVTTTDDGRYFKVENVGDKYIKFTVFVKSDGSDCDVNLNATLANSEAYTFAAIEYNGEFTVLGEANSTYKPLLTEVTEGSTLQTKETTADYVVDADEAAAATGGTMSLGSDVTAAGKTVTKKITLDTTEATGNNVKEIVFYMWAEGQHADCNGNTTDSPNLTLNYEKVVENA